jgi:ABC-type antimicrobial peptide transport system permease subunit
MHLPLVLLWQIREISVSAVFQDAISLTSKYLSASAYIIMFVAGIVIYIINKRYAFEQRKQTGTLYAFGVSSNMIYQTFMLRTLMLSLIGIGGGVGSSWFLLKLLAGTLGNRWGVLQLQLIFNTSILVKVCVIVFVVVHFFTYLAVKENVKMTPYEALRGKPTEFGKNIGKDNLLSHFGISLKYPLRNLLRNKNRSILTVFAFFGAILLSFSLIVAQNSVYETVDTYYEEQMNWDIKSYLHTYSYTESDLDFLDNNSLIENYEPYLETLVQPVDYPEILIIIRGIQPNSDLLHIDLQEGEMFSDSQPNGCILSKFIAERLNLNITDKLSLWLGSTQINLTVIGFARDMDATASMFVLLPDLEQILGHTLINGALISVADQNLPETAEYLNTIPLIESLIEKQESKDRITQLISNQTLIVQVMVILGFIISFITIFTTAFITAIERQRELSLQSVFGFSNWQLLSQLFLETFILICVAVLLGFAGGHFLAQFWLSIISEIFFKIDLYYNIHDFLISGGISLLAAGFSIYPGFKMMQKQNLASSIREE